jgi:hypothetical protein
MSGNEASAIGSLRAINSGESTYSSSCGGNGYAETLEDLSLVPPGSTAAFISPDLATTGVSKSGYTVTLATDPLNLAVVTLAAATCNGSAANALAGYYAHDEPVTLGSTGQRSFATDSKGTIYFLNAGTQIPADTFTGASPLQ